MKLFFALTLLLPMISFAEVDPNIQDRIGDATCQLNPLCSGFNQPPQYDHPRTQQWTYYCQARDYGRRMVQGNESASLRQAQKQALRACQTMSGRSCRLVQCYKY